MTLQCEDKIVCFWITDLGHRFVTPWKYWWQSLSVFHCFLHTGTELGAPPSVSSSQQPHFISVLLSPFYRREAGGEGLSNLPQVQKTGWGRCGADLGQARGAPHCYGMLPPNQCRSGIPLRITDICLFVPFLVFKRLYEQTESSLNETALLRYNWCIIIYTYWKCTIWEILTCLHSTCDTHTHTHHDQDNISFSPQGEFVLLSFLPPVSASPHPRQPLINLLSLYVSLHLLKLYIYLF